MFVTRKRPHYNVLKHPLMPKGYTCAACFDQTRFDSAVTYQPDDDDIFVASYPKSGTTWLMNILYLMKNEGNPVKDGDNLQYQYLFIEVFGGEAVKAIQRPRVIKTHLFYHLTPNNPKSKYVFIARNPKDVVVSFYNHTRGIDKYYRFADGSFDDYFEVFMEGGCDSGDYFEMVPQWHAESLKRDNIHFVLYEDMKNDIAGEILKLAEFLGPEWPRKLKRNNDELLEKVIQHSSFEVMQKDCAVPRPKHLPFMRKGVVGDWKNVLSNEQSERINIKLRKTGGKYSGFDQLFNKYAELIF